MSKNTKIIVMLVLVFAVLAAYLFLTIKEVTIKTKVPQSSEEYNREVQEKIRKIEEAYKIDMKKAISSSELILADQNMDQNTKVNALLQVREDLKNMTVPVQFKQLHMDLFLAYSEFAKEDIQDYDTLITNLTQLLNQAKSAYDWLS